MAFSGGTFSRTFDCTTDRDNGVKILASKFDTELDGMATGLSTCILKDGTQTCTAAIPFAEGLTVPDNKTIVLGTNSDITIQYDESTNDSLEIAANVEGAALGIVLKADQGDDNADQHKVSIADGGTLTMASKISGSFVSYLTHTPNSTVADSTTAVAGNLTVGGDLTLGSGAVISEAELEKLDGITNGTVAADKAVVVDSNKDIASFRNVTLTGELDAGSLDISGDADIDGTLEADAITVNGTALNTVIAGVTVTDATNSAHVLVTDNESTNEENLITFVEDATSSTGNVGLEMDGNLTYNPSTGTVTATVFKGNIDAVDGDFDGTLEADAMTLNGTAITATATLDTGISNNNVPKFTSGVADNDFLRVDGTAIEGRSASEVLSDIAAAPAAGDSNIVTTGALNSGSITSGFGAIDNGSSNITTTGVGSFGSLDISGDIDVDGTTNLDVVDIDGAVDMASTLQVDGAITSSAGATITTADNTTQLTLTSTDADAAVGPVMDFNRNSASAADNDLLGRLNFIGKNDAGEDVEYGFIRYKIADASNGSEDGDIAIKRMVAGTSSNMLNFKETETIFNEDSKDIDFRVESDNTTHALFVEGSSGNVGINCTPDATFKVVSSGANLLVGFNGTQNYFDASENIFRNFAGAERARIDSGGNLLVGGTEINPQNQSSGSGSALRADGRGFFRATSATVLGANLQGNDGQVIRISKAGSELGGIYAFSSEIALVSGNTGLYFDDANNRIFPLNGSGGVRDNITDLGASNARFKDGYFSGQVAAQFFTGVGDTDTYMDIAANPANTIKFFTGGSERARFDSSGNFFVGGTSENAEGSFSVRPNTTNGAAFVQFNRASTTATSQPLVFYNGGSGVGFISYTNTGTTYNTTSDRRLKQDIEPLEATDKLMQMNPVSYSWKADPDGPRSMGFIAQEMVEVMPEAVSTGDDDMMSMDYGRITPILVSALQDAHRKIDELAAEIAELKAN